MRRVRRRQTRAVAPGVSAVSERAPVLSPGAAPGGGAGTPSSWRSSSGSPEDELTSASLSPPPSLLAGGPASASCSDSELSFTIGVTEATPYACHFCDKAFPRLSYLKRHEQVRQTVVPNRTSCMCAIGVRSLRVRVMLVECRPASNMLLTSKPQDRVRSMLPSLEQTASRERMLSLNFLCGEPLAGFALLGLCGRAPTTPAFISYLPRQFLAREVDVLRSTAFSWALPRTCPFCPSLTIAEARTPQHGSLGRVASL